MVFVILLMVYFQEPLNEKENISYEFEVIESGQLPDKVLKELSSYKPGSKHVFSEKNVTYAIMTPYVGETLMFRTVQNTDSKNIALISYEAMFIDESYQSDELIVKLEPYSGDIEFKRSE